MPTPSTPVRFYRWIVCTLLHRGSWVSAISGRNLKHTNCAKCGRSWVQFGEEG